MVASHPVDQRGADRIERHQLPPRQLATRYGASAQLAVVVGFSWPWGEHSGLHDVTQT